MDEGKRKLGIVVEDNMDIQKAYKGLMENANYEVLVAGNGIDAMPMIERYREEIHLILTDFDMPEMDGLEMLKRGLKTPLPHGNVLMATGRIEEKRGRELLKLYRAGILSGIILKPGVSEILKYIARGDESMGFEFTRAALEKYVSTGVIEKSDLLRKEIKKWRAIKNRIEALKSVAAGNRLHELNNMLGLPAAYIEIFTQQEPAKDAEFETDMTEADLTEKHVKEMEENPDFAGNHDIVELASKVMELKERLSNLLSSTNESRIGEIKNLQTLLMLPEEKIKKEGYQISRSAKKVNELRWNLQSLETRIQGLEDDPNSAGTHDDMKNKEL